MTQRMNTVRLIRLETFKTESSKALDSVWLLTNTLLPYKGDKSLSHQAALRIAINRLQALIDDTTVEDFIEDFTEGS